MLSFVTPIGIASLIVIILHGASKLGYAVHPFLLEPVFALWVIIVGIIIGFCALMRQAFLMLALILFSAGALVCVYVMYVL